MKNTTCLRLEEIASALSKADSARMAPELSRQDRVIMEQACVTLREAERAAIVASQKHPRPSDQNQQNPQIPGHHRNRDQGMRQSA